MNDAPQNVSFTTRDGVIIAADFYQAESQFLGAILCLHMMPSDRKSWSAFASAASALGWSILAIDERGHGESIKTVHGDQLDYRRFGPEGQLGKLNDVEAALAWLKAEKGIGPEKACIVGASIGANLAIRWAASDHAIRKVAAISPGLNYSGVETADAAARLAPEQSLLLVASQDDAEAFEAVQELRKITPAQAKTELYEKGGHATYLFAVHPELIREILDFLQTD